MSELTPKAKALAHGIGLVLGALVRACLYAAVICATVYLASYWAVRGFEAAIRDEGKVVRHGD